MKPFIFSLVLAVFGFGLGWMWPSSKQSADAQPDVYWQSVLSERSPAVYDAELRTTALAALKAGDPKSVFAKALESQLSAIADPAGMAGHFTQAAWARDSLATELAFALLAKHNPQQAIAQARELTDRTMRARFLAIAIDAVGNTDHKRGLELLAEFAYMVYKPPRFILQDPAATAIFFESLPPSRLRDGLIEALPMAWASIDPKAAMDWTMTQHQSIYQQQGIMKAWSQKDLSAMTDYLTAMPESREKALITGRVAGLLLQEKDIETAVAWADAHVATEAFPAVMEEALSDLIDEEPEKAMALAISRGALPEKLIRRWAYEDGVSAMSWASEVSDLELSETLTLQALQVWAGKDPSAAATQVDHWIAEGQPVPTETLNIVGNKLAISDPVTALSWAASLPETKQAASVVDQASRYFSNFPPARVVEAMRDLPVDLIDERIAKSVLFHIQQNDSIEAAETWMSELEARRQVIDNQ